MADIARTERYPYIGMILYSPIEKQQFHILVVKSLYGAESLNQLHAMSKANGLLNERHLLKMSALPVNGGLEIIMSQYSGSYL